MSILCFVILLFMILNTHAKKESLFESNSKEKESLVFEIIKRLGISDLSQLEKELVKQNNEGSDGLSRDDDVKTTEGPVCSMSDVKKDTIIRASESIENGADFIDSFKDTESNDACSQLCCSNTSCDISVYQDKEERYCYLFRCEGKCVFKQHVGYMANAVRSVTSQPEDELLDLNLEPTPNSKVKVTVGEKSEVMTEANIAAHTVTLTGYCQADIHCEDPNAVCLHRTCHCKDGFYNKRGICRKVCPKPQFECYELGTLTRGPECVTAAQVCDSYMQCADGSDEFNCQPETSAKTNKESKENHLHLNPSPEVNSPPVNKGDSSEDQSSESHQSESSEGEKSHQESGSLENSQSSEEKQISSEETQTSQAPSDSVKDVQSDLNNKSAPAKEQSASADRKVKAKSPQKVSSNMKQNQPKPVQHTSNRESVFMKEVIIAGGDQSAEGPIIALALGLAFTLVLLCIVGCRLRTVRTRLRKGRPLSQNEADYLINGMYL